MGFSVKGLAQIQKKVEKMQNSLKDAEPILDEIADSTIKNFKQNFKEKGKRLDQPWPPRKLIQPHPLMIDTGNLRRGFEKETKKDEMKITNPIEYAKYHQFGIGKMPQRKIVGSSRAIRDLIRNKFIKHFKNIFNS